jgi:hypothetical protein
MTMTNANFFSQTRGKVITEPACTDSASVSDPSRPEYNPKSPHYDPRLDRDSPQFCQGLTVKPYTGSHTGKKPR